MLLAFSGKKQSGKDSCARFVAANANIFWPPKWHSFNGYKDSSAVAGETSVEFIYVGGPMKGFALEFGVPYESVWGTDEQKNMPIGIKWEQLPHYQRLVNEAWLRNANRDSLVNQGVMSLSTYFEKFETVPTGPLTGRQFLQQIGEEMFLPMDPLYWVKKYEAAVAASKAAVKLTADPRKPEQIHAITRLGGYTFKLLRAPFADTDQHESEVALDPDRFDQTAFHAVIDNRHLTVPETNRQVLKWFRHLGIVRGRIDLGAVNWEPARLENRKVAT
jgi:hypothetical protein